jgi:aryl-alcohol dehydrogenase-like predicted oxidoreductase/histidinol phosphatase-like enzyme/adenylate kinase family enzyme
MRLSTEPGRDDSTALATLHAALDAGVTLLDTADSYCWDDAERGHNERLIARALAAWPGDRSRVTIATKGGIVRPDRRWQPDGRRKHLIAACEASCRALGVDRIPLYQLHSPDPRVPLATSVRALAALKRDGRVQAIGLCNVTVGQIEEARRLTEIDAIQVELSLWHDEHFLSGVAGYCLANRLRLLAYRPLGGRKSLARTAANPVLNAIAARHGATPFEVALAWLAGFSPLLVPLPGPTRVETAHSAARAVALELTDDDCAEIDAICPAARALRPSAAAASMPARQDVEVVLIMGLPAAGKTTLARSYAASGFERLNRDDAGGTLRNLAAEVDHALRAGRSRLVLDNTYVSRKSRAPVIRAAAAHGVAVRGVWLDTSIDDAQVNAVSRILERYGRLPDEGELEIHRKQDPSAFPPMVQYRFQRDLEPPDPAEGFSRIDVVPFERTENPTYTARAVVVWCDGVLLGSRSNRRVPADADDVMVDPARAATLRRYEEQGFRLLGLSWQPEVGDGRRSRAEVAALFARMNELMGLSIDVDYCPHPAGPPRCWCRKPLPGLGVLLIQRHRLAPAACVYVGASAQDPGFARRLGFSFRSAAEFFAAPVQDARDLP